MIYFIPKLDIKLNEYRINPSLDVATSLWETIKENIGCLPLYPTKQLQTNFSDFGSLTSGSGKKYVFCPYFSFWRNTIEGLLRGKVSCIFQSLPHLNTFFIREDSISVPCVLSYEKPIIDYFKNIIDQFGFLNIFSHPHEIQELLFSEQIVEFFEKYNSIITITSSDAEPFFNQSLLKSKGVFVNDQMIDWRSGVNFYTCKYNKKHFLPIFHISNNGYINLLNLNQTQPIKDDIFKLKKEKFICECGKLFADFEFISHHKNAIIINGINFHNMKLIENITTPLKTIQFIYKNNQINVYYDPFNNDLCENDKEIIFQHFKMNIEFVKNQRFKVGLRKYPAFWNV